MTDPTDLFASWARELGIPLCGTSAPDAVDPEDGDLIAGPLWDGATLYTGELGSPEDWAHEVAHWAVAAPERRTVANYGLGPDWTMGFSADIRVDDVSDEECAASVLGICWTRSAGGAWMANALDHCWLDLDGNLDPLWQRFFTRVAPWVDRFDDWLASGPVRSTTLAMATA